jgi:DNA-binding transcriptional regulator LsrR (DeoR family)
MKFDEMSLRKRQMMVGVARQLYDEGLTTKEVAAKMCLSESTVRSIKKTIDQAKANGMK